MGLGLIGLLLRSTGTALLANPMAALTLVIVGASGVIAILLPFTAESYPLRIRGRATGWIAGCSKLGGLIAQGSSVLGVAPPLGAAALLIVAPTAIALWLIAQYGRETRGRDLRVLEHGEPGAAI
ncbi:MAG: MFS transporter [Proteobacteria bacterium]|nr:MAG: MFS transporter [Pseudomonadota bacterium]